MPKARFDDFNAKIFMSFNKLGVQTRARASLGLWLTLILPVIMVMNVVKYPYSSDVFVLSSVFSFGTLCSSVIFLLQCFCLNDRTFKSFTVQSSSLFVCSTGVYYFYFRKGLPFCLFSSAFSTFGFFKSLLFILRVCPLTFSVGESFIVTQGILLFLYSSLVNIYYSILKIPNSSMSISTLILQIGLIGICVLSFCVYRIKILRRPLYFYVFLGFIVTIILLTLQLLLRKSPILWIFEFILENNSRIGMLLFWLMCVSLAIIAVYIQVQGKKKADTSIRKIFHLLAVAVYIPGLLQECTLLYLASGILLAVLIMLEMLRVLDIPPFNIYLQDSVSIFLDSKDSGIFAMTPIYLLVGCSFPLWIHPISCDITDSAGFNLLPLMSGILAVGVGDSAASFIGSYFGNHNWSGTKKTIEGTLGSIICQFLIIYCFIHFGYIINNVTNVIKISLAVVIGSIVEAKTDQIDNLAIPFILFVILL